MQFIARRVLRVALLLNSRFARRCGRAGGTNKAIAGSVLFILFYYFYSTRVQPANCSVLIILVPVTAEFCARAFTGGVISGSWERSSKPKTTSIGGVFKSGNVVKVGDIVEVITGSLVVGGSDFTVGTGAVVG